MLAQALLGVKRPGTSFELLLHVGTLAAVLVYFRATLWQLVKSVFDSEAHQSREMLLFLIIGSIPAGLVGVLLEDFFDRAFSSPLLSSSMLIVTGLILLSTKFVRYGTHQITVASSLLIGVGQALAILPGISRSGSTIAAGILLGVRPSQAAEFSFLLSIPAVGGAVLLKSRELTSLDPGLAGPYLAGTFVSFALALAAVYTVLETVKRGRFEYFAYYCFAAGLLGLYLFI